ncbi:uncharacterized protein LOC119297810 [Triticum dicoccoides]|uniref:Uncharacterized protein n=1 Tax=Triticum turgidum subsp. durum TaxID=4567 RepID=A0A9R0WRX2_TRITD|nr:uncharacterized protein LOC119297810 [Triticum dicoccoides]XP_044385486.1 uncharacterized protein LOC123107579 [Triticum aestivum]VAI20602.1 unnamed protein product [Triticum turgidum subsp. durum]
MAEHGEEDLAVAAAKILLSLRSRTLVRWPEWIARPSDGLQRPQEEEGEAELPPIPEGWPKRPRSRSRLRARAEGTASLLSQKSPLARPGRPVLGGSGACSGEEEERAWSAPKAKPASLTGRRPEVRPQYGSASAAGSGPSTSGADRARSRRRARVSEKATAGRAESSPETPFDFANAAGSGASSSGNEAARPTAELGSDGRPSDSHEGHDSPAKRSRTDLAAGEATATAAKVEEQKTKEDYRDEKGHLLFDLNEAWGGN